MHWVLQPVGCCGRMIKSLVFELNLYPNLHSPERRLIELRIEHSDLDALIDRTILLTPLDELVIRRLKKRRLAMRDEMQRLERTLSPNEPA
jgi:hypothetical protein